MTKAENYENVFTLGNSIIGKNKLTGHYDTIAITKEDIHDGDHIDVNFETGETKITREANL